MNDDMRNSIIIIEKKPRNLELLVKFVNQLGHNALPISSIDTDLASIIDNDLSIKLALVDISDFDKSIWDWCEIIRNAGISLLIVSKKQSIELTNHGIKHGASGILIKPLVMKDLTALINSLLEG